ncbi:glycoside hydrolase family 3 protein [Solirubrobacter sp. CPCC 204708]|uniref:Glycoside hydrolase family 3 protein n=1 Tax=Solirubrobacter deserti TaxID=2282478 RepID=A0ABT4RST1_9ACTN|nr:glycoside hydrolase family 3 protein [Solirubrobacter deserti]MBE2316426.1 glycoside hydrolase family 3 protein [Solirubrobacter deserti]MDA0141629.1 glycoside hydrolase family 3 protein [Solirubrobacter deserti]
MPSPTAVRRRRVAVASAAAVALFAGVAIGAGDEEAPTVREVRDVVRASTPTPTPSATSAPGEQPVDELTLKQQVGQLIVLRFQGTTAPAYVRNALRKRWTSGAILFKDNITDAAQLKRLTRQLRRASPDATPIVSTDQEGGEVRRIAWAPPASGQAGQVPGRDAKAAAQALKAHGLNVSFAPVADVPTSAASAMRGRAFSTDPNAVARATKAAVEGWRAGGVAATAKHFPGLGGATTNTDYGSASIAGAPTTADLAPFKAAIAAKVPLIMSSNARYPRLDPDRIAGQSSRILEDLLRKELKFQGVVITDSIEAASVRATGSTEQIAVRSIRAGNDIVLTTGQGSWLRAFRALEAEAKRSKAFRERVRTSAARVLALQENLS